MLQDAWLSAGCPLCIKVSYTIWISNACPAYNGCHSLKKPIFCLALLGTTTLNSCWEYCSTALNLFYKWEEGGQAITLGHFCTLLRKHHSTVKCTWSQLCRKHYSFSLPWRWSESSPLATCIFSVWNWNRVGQSIRYQIAVELYLKDFEVRKELIISK